MEELSRADVFVLYEEEVYSVAEEIASELEDGNNYDSLNGREWCEENNVPESAFADAIEWFVEGVDWGVSPMYPFKNDEETFGVEERAEETEAEETEEDDE